MTRYIIRRLLQAIPLLFVISVLVFALIQVMPNNPLAAMQNNPNISPEDLLRLEQEYGLRDPLPVKYWKWLSHDAAWRLGRVHDHPSPGAHRDRATGCRTHCCSRASRSSWRC